MTTDAAARIQTTWEQLSWRGEDAWRATSAGLGAVVTAYRQRLIYFGPADGSLNLLNAPHPCIRPDAVNRWPNQGGHRFWLGPQSRWTWPPPADWEYSAAQRVEAYGTVLRISQPQQDSQFPAIVREYAWEKGRLRCTARWADPHGRFFAMHVVPVDLPFTGTAGLVKSPGVPHGFVEVCLDGSRIEGFLPHPAVTVERSTVRLTSGLQVFKGGFASQPLRVERPAGWQLIVWPGPSEGIPVGAPDHGYLSQIWVGSVEHELAELEQLSPYLRSEGDADCASSIFIDATPPIR